MQKKYDFLIVGSGLFGSTFAHLAKKNGKRVLVVDKRSHLGGNVYCENIEGINVHRYGAHIFHTNNHKVWNFVNGLVRFNRYTNCPVANYHGKLYNLPFNMNTFHQVWGDVVTPAEAQARIQEQTDKVREDLKKAGLEHPATLEQQAKLLVGEDIFNILIKGYTEKQWGRACSQLPPFIIKRLPVRFTYDNNYFNDAYQGIPIGGYNKLIAALLEGIETFADCDFLSNRKELASCAEKIVFTGQIDEYFGYCFGPLEYRNVRFETSVLDNPNYQGNAVINYTDCDTPWTRIIEHKHFELFGDDVYSNPKTVITKEYSSEWKIGMEPFYPVNDDKNANLFQQYKALADKEKNVIFGGRLAEYRYYDMAPVIEKAMSYWPDTL